MGDLNPGRCNSEEWVIKNFTHVAWAFLSPVCCRPSSTSHISQLLTWIPLRKYSQSSISAGFASMNSTNHGSKIFGKQYPRESQKATLEFVACWALHWVQANEMMCRPTLLWPICKYRLYANTLPFCIRDLSICRCGCPLGSRNPIPSDTKVWLYMTQPLWSALQRGGISQGPY